jgi:hypothetical protein
VHRRVEPRFLEQPRPVVVRFLVELTRLAGPGFVNGRVKPLARKFPSVDDQLPGPVDRFLFEVIAEAPIPQHLKKGVVIGVEPDVIEIVMLPAGANTLLRVDDARRVPGRFLLPEENRDELVHPGIGEKQVRRVRQKRARGHDGVLFLAKEIEKGLPDLRGSHFA